MIITQNGKPVYVIESYESKKRQDEAIALLKFISFSKNDVKNELVMSSENFAKRIEQKKLDLNK